MTSDASGEPGREHEVPDRLPPSCGTTTPCPPAQRVP